MVLNDGTLKLVYGPNGETLITQSYTKVFDYDGSGNVTYDGFAVSGSATSSALWAIRKYTYDGSGYLTSIKWADGDGLQNNIWDNRASLSYS